MSAIDNYFETIGATLEALSSQREALDASALAVADTVAADGLLHVFGTGHSHLLAAELFYRAGGLGAVNPILVEGLLLHAGAELSTTLERTAGLGPVIFSRLGAASHDTLLVISNSGSNVIARELIGCAKDLSMTTIALTSMAHATSSTTRIATEPRIHELADIVIDNGGVAGDAAVSIPGLEAPMGPTSTAIGAVIVNAIAIRAAEIVAERGGRPPVFVSSNVAGGDAMNRDILDHYRPRVRSL